MADNKIIIPPNLKKDNNSDGDDDSNTETCDKSETVINFNGGNQSKFVIPKSLKKNMSKDEGDYDMSEHNDNSETVIDIKGGNNTLDTEKKPDSEEIRGDLTNIGTDGVWNYKIVLLLQKIGKRTMGYRWMHDQESQNNDTQNNKFMIAQIVLDVLNATVTGSTMVALVYSANLQNDLTTLYILTAISLAIQIASGVVTGIRESSDFSNIAAKHNYAAIKFGEINLDIQNQLSLNVEDRDTDKDFLKNIIKRYNDLNMTVPQISDDVKKRYVASDEDNDVYNPIIIGDYNNIQIVDKKSDDKEVDEEKGSKSKYEIDRWLSRF